MATEAQLPDLDTAYQNLFMGIRRNSFLNKLASFGIAPQNQQQEASLFEMAGMLRQYEEEAGVKAASAGNDPFGAVNQSLQNTLQANGFNVKRANAMEQHAAYAVADHYMQDPAVYNSVLAFKAAEAAEYTQEVQRQAAGQAA